MIDMLNSLTWVQIADFIMHVKKQVYSENVMYI
jgi:hypothetical protein